MEMISHFNEERTIFMRLTGKEKVSLYTEKNGESNFNVTEANLEQLINVFILNRMCQQLIINNNDEKLVTTYLAINDTKIFKGTKVSLKFQISLKKNIPFLKKIKYIANFDNVDISEFYNHVIELFDFYAYELDTVIDNIKLKLIELKFINN